MVEVGGESEVVPVIPVVSEPDVGLALASLVCDESPPSVSPVAEPEFVQATTASNGNVKKVVRMTQTIVNRR